jgi:hypothetical protein
VGCSLVALALRRAAACPRDGNARVQRKVKGRPAIINGEIIALVHACDKLVASDDA